MIDKKYIKSLAKSITDEQKKEEEKKVKISFSTSAKNKEILKRNDVDISSLLDDFVSSLCGELEALQVSQKKEKPKEENKSTPQELAEKVQARIEEKKLSGAMTSQAPVGERKKILGI